MQNKKSIKLIFELLKKEFNFSRKVELDYTDAYTLLVATVLSAQTTDKQVNKVTEKLFNVVKTPQDALNLGEEKLTDCIKSINLYKTKAKNIILLSEKIINNFNGQIPDNMEDLLSLNGVGRKTANIILNVIFHKENAIAVDTHVFRVSNRICLTNAKNAVESEKQLLLNIPMEYQAEINHCLVLLGRYVCKAKNPDCEHCVIRELCNKIIK